MNAKDILGKWFLVWMVAIIIIIVVIIGFYLNDNLFPKLSLSDGLSEWYTVIKIILIGYIFFYPVVLLVQIVSLLHKFGGGSSKPAKLSYFIARES